MEKSFKLFSGAGYLISFAIGTLIAVTFVFITGIHALIGAIAGSISIPLGMVIEKKIQGKGIESDSKSKSFMLVSLILGIFLLSFFCISIFLK